MQGDDRDDDKSASGVAATSEDAAARRVVSRLGWGARADEIERFEAGGHDSETRIAAWLERQLGNPAASDPAAEQAVARVDAVLAAGSFGVRRRAELRVLARRVHTDRPLVERLVAMLHELVAAWRPLAPARFAARDARLRAALARPLGDLLAAELPADRVAAARAQLPRQLVMQLVGSADPRLLAVAEDALADASLADGVRALALDPAFVAPGRAPLPPLDVAITALRLFEVDMARLVESAADALVVRLEALGQPVLADAAAPLRAARPRIWGTTRSRAAGWGFGTWLMTVESTVGRPLVDAAAVVAGPPSIGAIVDGWSRRLLGRVVDDEARRSLLALGAAGTRKRLADVVAALWTSPALHTR
ncbi:MAG: DUF1800 family protein [Acidobacteriota bacterium]